MSALAPKADMCGAKRHVRFVPKADIRLSALRGYERANLARVGEDYVRAITHHSSIYKCRRVLLRTIVAGIRF
jgi:hypothetical protein